MKRLSLVLSLVLFVAGFALAQTTVTGTVTDEAGESLIGASILVKGTTSGTVTDLDGKYSLSVPDGSGVLVFSYTGFDTQEIEIGTRTVVDIIMSEGVSLGEVVVTALGVEREEKALGYAVQQVTGDDVARSGASNAVDGLVGKAAGIQVTRSSGSVGGGSRILIRGVTSMVGNNQPLIVIDGVRTNNETLLSQSMFGILIWSLPHS
jgi:outer membrane receptor protein involved in Fe transport